MINAPLLRSQLALREMSAKDLAKALGRSTSTIYRKIRGKAIFTVEEVRQCKKVLNLDASTAREIFFESDLS